jgi:catechol 2,3-dioxygenase-like lactoylglutathione lyase family enzyme
MISHIDHLVLTVESLDTTCDFYVRTLGFERQDVAGKPTALHFGQCKINVHQRDHTFEPKAAHPTYGSADFCLITEQSLDSIQAQLKGQHIVIEEGPVSRNGARGPMMSIYFRDPDQNLVEVSHYD